MKEHDHSKINFAEEERKMENRQNTKNMIKMRTKYVVLAFIVSILMSGAFVKNAHADFIGQGSFQYETMSKKIYDHLLYRGNSRFCSNSFFDLLVDLKSDKKEEKGHPGIINVSQGIFSNMGLAKKSGIDGFDDPSSQQPVPEPATMLLLGTGILGLAGTVRHRKIKKA